MKKTLLLATLFLLLPPVTQADGGIFLPPETQVRQSEQRAAIFSENGTETIIVSMTFKGEAKDFAWVIPTPSRPQVSKGSDEVFTSLAKISYWRERPSPIYIMETGLGTRYKEEEKVTLIETKKVDYYEISVLSATDPQALSKWLNDHGYQYPEESSYIFNDYIANNWYFIAVKISPEAEKAEEVAKGLKEGHATPLKIVFSSSAIIYPMRLTGIQPGEKKQVKCTQGLVLNEARIEELEDLEYKELTDPASCTKILNQIAEDVFLRKPYQESSAAKYPEIIPENTYNIYLKPLPPNINVPYISSTEKGIRTVEGWFNSYFIRQGLKLQAIPSSTRENYIQISLWVMAEGKKEIPGFTTRYANWIEAKKIKELAYDLNGRPLLEPQGKKYFLTYFWRNMSTSQMNTDFIIREASDNKKVNAGPETWLLVVYGILIVLGVVFLWLFSPLGIIFIVATLIWFLTKSRGAKITALVLEAISYSLTFILFVISFILTFTTRDSTYPFLWSLSTFIGLGIVLSGVFLVRFKQILKARKEKILNLNQNL